MFRRKSAITEDRDPRRPGRIRRAGDWYLRSNATLIASGLLVLVLLAGVVYLVVVPPPDAGTPGRGDTVVPTTTGAPDAADLGEPALVPPAPTANFCPDQDRIELAPETVVSARYDTLWEPSGGAALPRSDGAGPRNPEEPRSCFARSPEGALYSLATFFIESLAAPDAQSRIRLVQARASRSGAYQQLMDQLGSDPGIAVGTGPQPQMQIVGYRWVGYTPDSAQLDLHLVKFDGARVAPVVITAEAIWEANDWLVVVPNQSSVLHPPGAEQADYTEWGPPE